MISFTWWENGFSTLFQDNANCPIGAFGGMAYTISKYGVSTLLPLGKLMLTVYITMFIFIFGVLWLILKYYCVSVLRYLKLHTRRTACRTGNILLRSRLAKRMEKLEKWVVRNLSWV